MRLKILALGNKEATRRVESSLRTANMEVSHLEALPESMGILKQSKFNLALVDSQTEDIKNVCFRIIWLGRIPVAVLGQDIQNDEKEELRSLGVNTFLSVDSSKTELVTDITATAVHDSLVFFPVKVIIIEDDNYIREAIRLCFRIFWPEAELRFADDGHSGIENIRNYPPDIVLLDLGLPDMSGFDVLKRVRFFSQVPVVILSAARDKTNIVEAIEAGARDYIIKPFKQTELIPRIKKYSGH
ncbi:MAG: response regulator [Dehalococcoidales bacterium]|nr:response regulator [Dehalococcoidales bacterium]